MRASGIRTCPADGIVRWRRVDETCVTLRRDPGRYSGGMRQAPNLGGFSPAGPREPKVSKARKAAEDPQKANQWFVWGAVGPVRKGLGPPLFEAGYIVR